MRVIDVDDGWESDRAEPYPKVHTHLPYLVLYYLTSYLVPTLTRRETAWHKLRYPYISSVVRDGDC